MRNLIRRIEKSQRGFDEINVTPKNAYWKYVGFHYMALPDGRFFEFNSDDMEVCIVLIAGKAEFDVENGLRENVGQRMHVWENEKPFALFASGNRTIRVTGNRDCEIGICSAPAKTDRPTRLITPDELQIVERGKGQNLRFICDIMMANIEADSLLVVEVKTPSGNWSSYPPHKHDKDNLPHESHLEETYFHKIFPTQGYIHQRVFNDDLTLNETMTVHNNEVVLVPEGYHPVGVPYGYESYYLNTMAGPTRQWVFNNHPDHAWIIDRDSNN